MPPKKKMSSKSNGGSPSPSASPPLPPAPSMAKNKGSATQDRMTSEPQVFKELSKRDQSQRHAGSTSTDIDDISNSAVPVPGMRKGSFRRLLTRILILYLGYTILFVCPTQSIKDTSAVCAKAREFQNWLHPYSQPIYEKLDKTYRFYAEPYFDQYGRPLQKHCQKYYTEVAEPAIKSASEKAKTSYYQFAHPHVAKAIDVVYTEDVKNYLDRAQKSFSVYKTQAYGHSEQARKVLDQKLNHASNLYNEHIQPMINKATPHVKAYWERASTEASKAYDLGSALYMKHVNPYAQHSFSVIKDAASNAFESLAWNTDEIWGTKFSKQNKSKSGRAANKASEVVDQVKQKSQDTVKQADDQIKKAKGDADSQSNTLKDTVLKKAGDARKVVEETIVKVKEPVLKVVEEEKKAVVDEVEHLKNLAKNKVEEAGKATEHIKKIVVQKAHDAQEAVVRKAGDIRDTVQDQVHKVQEAGSNIAESIVGAKNVAKETVENQAEDIAKAAQDKQKEAKKFAQDNAQRVQSAFDAAANHAGKKAEEVKQSAQGYVRDAQDKVQEQAEIVFDSAEQIVLGGKEYARQQTEKVKDATETTKQKIHDPSAASKAALAAMLNNIESAFEKFYDYERSETKDLWSNLQSVVDDHISTARESAEELEKSSREAYEKFESYVRDWSNQDGKLDEKLSQLHHQSVESIKKIGLKAMDEHRAAQSKAQVLSNNIDVYISGLKGFLEDRLQASKETIDSELSVFKDTSSKVDGKTLTDKIQELELTARERLESAGKDAHGKVQELLNQAREIWTESESKSQEYLQLTRELAKKAREDAKAAVQNDPNIRIATEEPGSGHRHHRHQ